MKTVIKSEIAAALKSVGLQRGDAELKLMKQRELVDFAVAWIEKNR